MSPESEIVGADAKNAGEKLRGVEKWRKVDVVAKLWKLIPKNGLVLKIQKEKKKKIRLKEVKSPTLCLPHLFSHRIQAISNSIFQFYQ